MNLQVIEDNIRLFEEGDTTVQNVQNLANLYIVYDRLKYKSETQNVSQDELDDVMPAYTKYVETKRQCQMGYTQEEAVQHTLKLLTQELKEFIEELYANTSSRKERLCIQYLVKELNDEFNR